MTDHEIRLRVIEAVIAKAPQSPDAARLIETAAVLTEWVLDTPPKRGPGRPPKHSVIADTAEAPAP